MPLLTLNVLALLLVKGLGYFRLSQISDTVPTTAVTDGITVGCSFPLFYQAATPLVWLSNLWCSVDGSRRYSWNSRLPRSHNVLRKRVEQIYEHCFSNSGHFSPLRA